MQSRFILSLILVSSGFALPWHNTPPPSPPPPQDSPTPKYFLETNFTGFYLQPYANNLTYAIEALPYNYSKDDSPAAIDPSWRVAEIPSDYHLGFDLALSGIIQPAGSRIRADWEWYHSQKEIGRLNTDHTTDMVGSFFDIGPDSSLFKIAKGTATFHFNEISLNYGTFVKLGKVVDANFFAGASFLALAQKRKTSFYDPPERTIRTIIVPDRFRGYGPQVGLDFLCHIVKGFSFVGDTRASLFIGNFQNKTTISTTSPSLRQLGEPDPNIQTLWVEKIGGIVPGLETKLGFAIEFPFKGSLHLQIEAGYQAAIYINSLRSIDVGSQTILNAFDSEFGSQPIAADTGVYARTMQRTVSDYAMAGPYASFDLHF